MACKNRVLGALLEKASLEALQGAQSQFFHLKRCLHGNEVHKAKY